MMYTFTALKIIVAFVGLLALYYIHSKLSEKVVNNFQVSEPWVAANELVLLTGGSGGIGRQIMEDLSYNGVRVVILDVKQPPFELPKNVTFYQTDITSSTSLSETATFIRKEHGDPTIIINNAGVFHHGSILEKSEKDLRQTFDVNTVSHFLIMKEFLPDLISKNRGHVVTIASIASFVAVGEMVDYCCSKASALAFHEGLRQELKFWYNAPNVRTSIVHPNWVMTPLIKGFTQHQGEFGQKLMTPQVVSDAVLEHIFKRQSGQIVLPKHLGLAGSIRGFPIWLQEPIRSFLSNIVRRVSYVRSTDKRVTL
ncbi:hypothetical protein PENSTE_c006G04062 [Penicillium steckii]|uniref:Short-chain dehydrogenase/reductase 3 n=1 Tax=Penicillium steckii TaxID=303698 RepID=A0A1V6TGV3_9EURO|nr:hypothetical protein PENSTE_c006G04062 [Penicillium steckii]